MSSYSQHTNGTLYCWTEGREAESLNHQVLWVWDLGYGAWCHVVTSLGSALEFRSRSEHWVAPGQFNSVHKGEEGIPSCFLALPLWKELEIQKYHHEVTLFKKCFYNTSKDCGWLKTSQGPVRSEICNYCFLLEEISSGMQWLERPNCFWAPFMTLAGKGSF